MTTEYQDVLQARIKQLEARLARATQERDYFRLMGDNMQRQLAGMFTLPLKMLRQTWDFDTQPTEAALSTAHEQGEEPQT